MHSLYPAGMPSAGFFIHTFVWVHGMLCTTCCCTCAAQVRYAASVAARSFLEGLPKAAHDEVLPTLLPPMCLNRYYEAEGVRRYSQATWREIMGDAGRDKVAQFALQVGCL